MNKKTHNIASIARRAALAAAVAVCGTVAMAQEAFNMPFSQFGLGSQTLSMPMAERMGGAVLTRSGNNYVNPFNPASYAGIERESFVFDMGFNLQSMALRNGDKTLRDVNGNIGYLAIAMPITKWWKMAGGLLPYSTVDYHTVVSQPGGVQTEYHGSGGVNRIFLGSAFNIYANKRASLQAGFNLNYLTGVVQRSISHTFAGNDTTFYINSRKYKKTTLNNLMLDFGVQGTYGITEQLQLGVGITYKPYMSLSVADEALIYTMAADESLADTVYPARGVDPTFTSRAEQPSTIGLGISLQYNKQWLLAADAEFAQWQGLRYTEEASHAIFGNNMQHYGPTARYALGIERLSNMDAARYWGRIGWSVGANYRTNAITVEANGAEQSLDAWGIGAGISLPMRKGRSLLTVSVGYSSLGRTDVLQHNVLTFGVAVSSCERWFAKRKYN